MNAKFSSLYTHRPETIQSYVLTSEKALHRAHCHDRLSLHRPAKSKPVFLQVMSLSLEATWE